MKTRTIYRDRAADPATEEYLSATVESTPPDNATEAADLDGDVFFSLDECHTWLTAQWAGDQTTVTGDEPKKIRKARVLMTDANLPAGDEAELFVRVGDVNESPIASAGTVIVL